MLFIKKQIESTLDTTTFVVVKKLVHGKWIKVKVYESTADKYIKGMRERNSVEFTVKRNNSAT